MSWPTMSDYQEAVQNPANCFSDKELRSGTPKLNALGLPQPVTGGFCSVYEVRTGKSRWAVRCFLHNIKDLQDRYAQISKYLRSKRLKHMVGFEYVREGIRVRGNWHSVLKMEWVDGDNLNVWVGKHVKDPRALRKLAERWTELMEDLEKAKIGHCDLQHGNVLVDGGGNLRLIDYDGMYVPALRGRGSHEKGHPAYQHPQREGKDFDESVDRFSALVIHTSLLALAESSDLWKRFYEEDNLIFRRSDFQSPDSAEVFQALGKMSGPVADYAEALREACKRRLRDSPRLREVRVGKNGSSAAAVVTQPAAPAVVSAPAASPPPAAKPKPAPAPPAAAQAPPAKVIPFPARAVTAPAKGNRTGTRRAKKQTSRAATSRAATPPAKTGTQPAAAPKGGGTAAAVATVPTPTPALALVPAAGPGWALDWARPGRGREKHVFKVPVHGTREVPRRFLGIQFGTRREKFVERYEDRVEERRPNVAGHRDAVTSLAFAPDGKLLASGSRDGTVRVWSVQSGRETAAPLETKAAVTAIAFIPDRSLIAVALDDRRLMLWDHLHRQVTHFDSPDRSLLRAVAVSRDGRTFAAGGKGRSIFLWHVDKGAPAGEVRNTAGAVESLAFTPEGGSVVCGTHNGRIELHERGKESARWIVRTGLGCIVGLAAPPRAGAVVGGGSNGTVAFWDLKDGSEQKRLRPMRGRMTSLAVSPDAGTVLVGLRSNKACVAETGTDPEVAVLEGHRLAVTAAALPAAGKHAATGAADGSLRIWVAP